MLLEENNQFDKYTETIAKTPDFKKAYDGLKNEILHSFEDSKITKEELAKIAVKMFHVIKILHDKNFKLHNVKFKQLVHDDFKGVLKGLVQKTMSHFGHEYDDDYDFILDIIINTAEWSINIASSNCGKIFCC